MTPEERVDILRRLDEIEGPLIRRDQQLAAVATADGETPGAHKAAARLYQFIQSVRHAVERDEVREADAGRAPVVIPVLATPEAVAALLASYGRAAAIEVAGRERGDE